MRSLLVGSESFGIERGISLRQLRERPGFLRGKMVEASASAVSDLQSRPVFSSAHAEVSQAVGGLKSNLCFSPRPHASLGTSGTSSPPGARPNLPEKAEGPPKTRRPCEGIDAGLQVLTKFAHQWASPAFTRWQWAGTPSRRMMRRLRRLRRTRTWKGVEAAWMVGEANRNRWDNNIGPPNASN